MSEFVVKNMTSKDIASELEKIGFDSEYRFAATDKFNFKNLQIFDLSPAQANILKQTALSVGADCATHRDVITGKVEKSNVILGGTVSELKKIAEKLKTQPFSLSDLGEKITEQLNIKRSRPKLAGIVNVTPDSFSDGGKYLNPEDAIRHVYELVREGADIIDIGAESTRPYSNPVPFEEQISRLGPVLDGVRALGVPISVDTRSSFVAEYALKKGATIINDVSGMSYDPRIGDIAAQYNATIILQHSQGTPENMQDNPHYKDVIEEVYFSLKNKIELAHSKGVKNIILDVGIGFGKTKEDNFEILNRIEDFFSLNMPIMVGLSRKSLLDVQTEDNTIKDALSLALSYPLMQKGVDYLRVHNVKLHKQLLNSAIL